MTMSLSCRVTEIQGLKYFKVTTLTFWLRDQRTRRRHFSISGQYDDHASILHGYEDTEPRRFWRHDLDLFEVT